ncbi:hypothetical protein PAXRUDRAFT_181220, partial [Paxillus rubicundulus Ve08.2h10]
FATQSCHFIDAYQRGLNGQQAGWATKKYHGHRVLLKHILWEFDTAHSSST